MESRNIMWIGLAQVLAVVLGFVLLGVALKFHGWPDETLFHFYPLTRMLRQYGFWLLLVPAAWTFYAMACAHVEKGLLSWPFSAVLGMLLVAVIFLLFLLAAGKPGARGILIHIGRVQTTAVTRPGQISRTYECT